MKKTLLFILILGLLFSCEDRSAATEYKWERDSNTRAIRTTDQAYLYSVSKAQAELATFTSIFSQRHDSLDFYIKASFTDENGTEHMWVDVYSILKDTAFGTLGNDAIKVKYLQFGDSVNIALNKIEDFTIYKNDSVIAGDFLNQALSK
ncbi:DUF2314 domain-containing protein [Pseudocnuella soli]|uniref:DUF2314 domain-containing protein n=1 Tax=Pseudocnuella soli TaxID=2502779 RepID=UPI00140442CB|nr:DUF2314 domain-containing protein [Pseudocnuella soli]